MVEAHTIKHLGVLQWTIEVARQNWPKIDYSLTFIIERNFQGIRTRLFKRTDFAN